MIFFTVMVVSHGIPCQNGREAQFGRNILYDVLKGFITSRGNHQFHQSDMVIDRAGNRDALVGLEEELEDANVLAIDSIDPLDGVFFHLVKMSFPVIG